LLKAQATVIIVLCSVAYLAFWKVGVNCVTLSLATGNLQAKSLLLKECYMYYVVKS